jgi:hypothetical protein
LSVCALVVTKLENMEFKHLFVDLEIMNKGRPWVVWYMYLHVQSRAGYFFNFVSAI